jgi:RNA polymerase sigma-70 factor (ECF subfamily)
LEIIKVVEGCKSGNQFAENALFDKYYKHMFNLSRRILGNHNDVEDVLIISFTKVFGNIKKFEYRGDYSLTKWIKTIVINESIRFVNKRNKIKYDDNIPELIACSEFDSDLNDIDIEQIYSIIEKMPSGYRIVFNLFAIEGYSHKEIAELLKISENTSKSQLRKARIDIIKKMDKIKNNGKA